MQAALAIYTLLCEGSEVPGSGSENQLPVQGSGNSERGTFKPGPVFCMVTEVGEKARLLLDTFFCGTGWFAVIRRRINFLLVKRTYYY